ncbi:hypothetical protein M433DRAFT_158342 [Acidomyces richmondensis BFW]|nr:MAG: hypothetical protein FE78DRAFT_85465 [Acidomyces sp. 'richmondensis']KYG42057.1 hypothetical protein M433DRAFT_158342 [Acidomyces richmondensis BFW]
MPSMILYYFGLFWGLSIQCPIKRTVRPTVSGTPQVVGIAFSPKWNRDSCTSTFVSGRELWTCRDSQDSEGAFLSSTASWTDFYANGTPAISNQNLLMYGENPTSHAYFEVQANECGPSVSGDCSDGNRYIIWPNSRPLPVERTNGIVSLYTWIGNVLVDSDWTPLNGNPSCSLYRADYSPGFPENELPPAVLLDEEFWPVNSIQYGNYGFVINNNTAYLYGLLSNKSGVALAMVPIDLIEDKSAYQYYTGSGWSSIAPDINDTSAAIANAGTMGQGTYYYSDYFSSYIWIGSPYIGGNANFQLTTAPAPEGPWIEPYTIYSGKQGSANLGAYSEQAHPGLSKDFGNGNDIYLTYTMVDSEYITPIIHVIWE